MKLNGIIKGHAHAFDVGLPSQASVNTFQANPTLAAGDFKISKDGGAFTNLATLPTVTPASGKNVKISLSATELDCDLAVILCSDAAGDEWADVHIDIVTSSIAIPFTVDTATNGHTPLVTEFQCEIVEATEDHFVDRIIIWLTGNLARQKADITASESVGGITQFTTPTMTDAPSAGDTGLIL